MKRAMQSRVLFATLASLLSLTLTLTPAADTLPSELSDEAFWKMLSEFSEPDKYYEPVLTSNEVLYQHVLPELTKTIPPGGVYFGVGPEQNFTYIAALRPKIAFLVDIRRDMMLEHLMYKALFEMTSDRTEFVGMLFGRTRPATLPRDASVAAVFQAYASVPGDSQLAEQHLKDIVLRLKTVHNFPLTEDDEKRIRSMYLTFMREGVTTFMSSLESPGYTRLMTATDAGGRNWSFLAAQEAYDRVRAMHQKNLIVPLVGDFGGPRALRMAGQYVREHGAIVNVFYVSNVEDYIGPPRAAQGTWDTYNRNVASLPIDDSSLFIRWSLFSGRGLAGPWLSSIGDFVRTGSR